MSYQVLARKWRPRTFQEMVGQEHVLKALINALDQERLHHAYLFTGTRGVGKTTIARILAKCLNCEAGVRSEPCGECSSCQEIAEGRFIDLIEVDAASRTRVEDTRELLDNVQYSPTRGRYKVYLIDEVHMLSTHSFNALLKTLEEPPPHVKFLLATTDPQKLPPTILSRCLQFNLKNMSPERIVGHLNNVLTKEGVSFEEPALWLLGRSADGSMRDALSLTDQAIAYGSGSLLEQDVRNMLGTIDRSMVFDLLEALSKQDASRLLKVVDELSEFSPDFEGALAELLTVLHRVAIAQAVPDAIDNSQGDKEKIVSFAQVLPGEDVQLFYQMGMLARRDLPMAPEPKVGFVMALLRMLAFRPEGVVDPPDKPLESDATAADTECRGQDGPTVEDAPAGKTSPAKSVSGLVGATEPLAAETKNVGFGQARNSLETVATASDSKRNNETEALRGSESLPTQTVEAEEPELPIAKVITETIAETSEKNLLEPSLQVVQLWQDFTPAHWLGLFPQLNLTGVAKNIAANCVCNTVEPAAMQLTLDQQQSSLFNDAQRQRIEKSIGSYFDKAIALSIEIGSVTSETPSRYKQRKKDERFEQVKTAIKHNPNIHLLMDQFGAEVDWSTVEPKGE